MLASVVNRCSPLAVLLCDFFLGEL
jgi:hypothetical protein